MGRAVATTFNPNAPGTIGLEWAPTVETLIALDAAAKNVAPRIVSSATETIDQLILPHTIGGPSSGYARQWVDVYDMASSPVAPAVTELTFVPNEDKAKSNVTRSDFGTTTNLYQVLDDSDDSGPPEYTDYMVNSNYGGTATYRCQFNTSSITGSGYRIVYVKFEIRAKGFDWSWQKPKIEFSWWNGSTDLGRFATINPEPDYVFRTRVLGPYYFDFYNEGRWLLPEIANLDVNTSRNLGVKLFYATAISRITMKVGVIPENRVAVGIGSKVTVPPSGRQTNSPMLFKTPLGVDNWAKVNGSTYMALVTRTDDPFGSRPALTPSYSSLDSGSPNPHGQGDAYSVTLTGQDGLVASVGATVGTAAFATVLGRSDGAQSVDTQPYHDFAAQVCHTTSTLLQGVDGATSSSYRRLRGVVGYAGIPHTDLLLKIKRTSDNVQMGGTATLTTADWANGTLLGTIDGVTYRLCTIDLASTATLASATAYYIEMTSATPATAPWYIGMIDATATHSLTGNITYGGSTDKATIAGSGNNFADFEMNVASTPTNLTNLTATVTTFALPENGGSTCEPGSAQYVALNWASSSLGGSFLRYEVERSEDLGTTWATIAYIETESESDYADYEVKPDTPELYRVRVVRTDGATSDWTTLAAPVTTARLSGALLLVSNADPSIACGFVILGPTQQYDFLDASESVYMAMHGRDMHVRFRPLEARGVRWSLNVLVYVLDEAEPDGGAPPNGAGIRAFDTVRAVGTATIPYVCVLTPWGERLFGAVDITTGVQTEPAHYYVATLTFTQTATEPTIVQA